MIFQRDCNDCVRVSYGKQDGCLQDSSPVQIRIAAALQRDRGQLTVVGDDAQSIYGFRGATAKAFSLLRELLPNDGLTVLPLQRNYRSVPAVIEVRWS